ncbi:hypothetical protein L1887_20138 [Cichorium endivia]|nr:hypothetical protein L1887_20138 [Cichorium endivia]
MEEDSTSAKKSSHGLFAHLSSIGTKEEADFVIKEFKYFSEELTKANIYVPKIFFEFDGTETKIHVYASPVRNLKEDVPVVGRNIESISTRDQLMSPKHPYT